jgi:amidophosphoribosyltransferase
MCGIVGLALSDRCSDAAIEILEGLCQLQHRGQDACGVAVATLQQAGSCMKGDGLLREVFNDSFQPDTLQGHFGIGHGEQSTTPCC